MDAIDDACGEIRVAAHDLAKADKIAVNDCNHIHISIEFDASTPTVGWINAIKQVLLQHETTFNKLRITQVEIVFQSKVTIFVFNFFFRKLINFILGFWKT